MSTQHTLHQEIPAQARRLHFIGIGGISMSSLAAIAARQGCTVSGSDHHPSPLTAQLQQEGVRIVYGHLPENVESADAVVYTAAIADDNPELRRARELGIPCLTRAAFMGELMKNYPVRIGVAGTHGKSSTTGMLSEIYLAGELNPTVVCGAQLPSLGGAYRIGGGCFLFEACEYTDSFLSFYPSTAVVTNVDLDHTDYFHSLEQYIESFARYLSLASVAVVDFDSPNARRAAADFAGKLVSYGIEAADAAYRPGNIVYQSGCASFDLLRRGENLGRIALSVPGEHNVGNALAAAAAALENGVPLPAVTEGLHRFGGASRRFEYKGSLHGARIYDDYAHHPTEIRATLAAAKKLGGRIICLFQPHTRSRLTEFFDGFAHAFSDADAVGIVDVYENLEHEELRSEHTSRELAASIPGARYLPSLEALEDFADENARPGDTILVMGAGSVTRAAEALAERGRMES